MRDVFFLAFAGALGTLGRYGLSNWTYRMFGDRFPYGTLAVNVLGCLVLGFAMQAGIATEIIPKSLKLAITVGFLGAFTTFSTFGFETMRHLREGAVFPAVMNIAANLVLGLVAVWIGLSLARAVFGAA